MFKIIALIVVLGAGGLFVWSVSSTKNPPAATSPETSPDPQTALEENPVISDQPMVDVTAKPAVEIPSTIPETIVATSAPVKIVSASPQTVGPFPITGTRGHSASGKATIVTSADERLVRFENYRGTKGPDLKIYLSNDLQASNFVNLGDSKGAVGTFDYTIPADVNLEDYQYVITWCEDFGVLFDYATIQ